MTFKPLIASAIVLHAAALFATPPAPSLTYKSEIEQYIAAKHLSYPHITFLFFEPASVLFGDNQQKRQAVKCEWYPKLANGQIPMGINRSTFLIDHGFIYETQPGEKITWLEGQPKREKKPLQGDPSLDFLPAATSLAPDTHSS